MKTRPGTSATRSCAGREGALSWFPIEEKRREKKEVEKDLSLFLRSPKLPARQPGDGVDAPGRSQRRGRHEEEQVKRGSSTRRKEREREREREGQNNEKMIASVVRFIGDRRSFSLFRRKRKKSIFASASPLSRLPSSAPLPFFCAHQQKHPVVIVALAAVLEEIEA